MAVLTIQNLLLKFGAGKSPRSQDYLDLIDTLADDRNAVYFSATAPEDTAANPLWFNTGTQVLSVYDDEDWVSGSAGNTEPGMTPLKLVSGRYYPGGEYGGSTSQNLQQTYYLPIYVPYTTTFDRIGTYCSGFSSGAAGTVRLGIFTESNGIPGSVLVESLVTYTAVGLMQATINTTLNPGWYFLASNIVSRTGTVNQAGSTRAATHTSLFLPANGTTGTTAYQQNAANATSAFPAVGTLLLWDNVAAAVVLRAA